MSASEGLGPHGGGGERLRHNELSRTLRLSSPIVKWIGGTRGYEVARHRTGLAGVALGLSGGGGGARLGGLLGMFRWRRHACRYDFLQQAKLLGKKGVIDVPALVRRS